MDGGEAGGPDAGEVQPSRPPYSYVALIAMALEASPGRRLPLRGIYRAIARRFPRYYRLSQKGWQNCVRHNLSLHACFLKVARRQEDEEEEDGIGGRGSLWMLDPDHPLLFEPGNYRRRKSQRRVQRDPDPPNQLPFPVGFSFPEPYPIPSAVGQPSRYQIGPIAPGSGPYSPSSPFPNFQAFPDLALLPCWGWQDPHYISPTGIPA